MLPDDERARAEGHVDACMLCRMIVAELALLETQSQTVSDTSPFLEGSDSYPGGSVNRILAPGTVVARYVVTRTVGSGRGGVVYEAYDPPLDRTVGLKILRSLPAEGLSDDGGQLGLLREAQAMAKLSHPNVVLIHDVGTFAGQVFMVVEYIKGVTLTEWLAEQDRPWRATLDMFVGAGRGLAAAHAANIIHRDFKPDNVLVGADGVPRLTDFGLARAAGLVRKSSRARDAGAFASDPAVVALQTAPAGTPAFMAPEQLRRGAADAKSDQFAFCVALHWSLFGHHPFRAETPRIDAPIDEKVKTDPVPVGVREALVRGLAGALDQRFASMDDLLAALTKATRVDPAPPMTARRRWVWLLLGGVFATGAAAAGWLLKVPATPPVGATAGRSTPIQRDRLVGGLVTPIRAIPEPPGTAHCEDRGVSAVGHCFKFYEGPLDWQSASEDCMRRGALLATCASQLECDGLANAASPRADSWLALRVGGREGGYAWVTGEEVLPYLLRDRVHQVTGTGPGIRQSCVVVTAGADSGRPWLARRCEERHGYVCELPQWNVAPASRHAYRILSIPSTWDEARDRCSSLGTHLATVADAGEQAFIERTVFSDITKYDAWWLGATDRAQHGKFAWTTGEPFSHSAFFDGEPDNQDGEQDCLSLDGRTRLWHDRYCSTKYSAVCEGEPEWTVVHLGK